MDRTQRTLEDKHKLVIAVRQYMRDNDCSCRVALEYYGLAEGSYYEFKKQVAKAGLSLAIPDNKPAQIPAQPQGSSTVAEKKRLYRSMDEKRQLVEEVNRIIATGVQAQEAAKQAGIRADKYYQWRKQLAAADSTAITPAIRHQRVVTHQAGIAGLRGLFGTVEGATSEVDTGEIKFSFQGTPAGLARFLKEMAR